MTIETKSFEGWAIVPGYEGIYEVSTAGRVRRDLGPDGGRILRDHENRGGYRSVQLWRDGRPRMHLVHVLVARAFLNPLSVELEVNHRDGNKTNNALTNLEYVTRSENARHAYRTALRVPTIEQAAAARRQPRTLVDCECRCGQRIETPDRKGRRRRFVSGHNARAEFRIPVQ